jgi:transposase
MKDAYMQEIVRKACLRDGKGKRTVARELGISRNTVKKLLRASGLPGYRLKKAKPRPVIGGYLSVIEAWLEADEKAPHKQRHTAKRIHERLVEEYGFTGSARRIREVVAELRKVPREVFLPLAFEPGEMAQVDWGEVWVWLGSVYQKVYVLVITLNYSGGLYVEAFDTMVQEAFFTGHAHAFGFFGGLPFTLTYDNLKTAVVKVLKGRNRIENERFVAFRSAYLFESRFCNPAKGNEKGRVENMVKFTEHNLFTPVPRANNLNELNALLKERCLKYQQHTQARQSQTVGEKMKEEALHWLALPKYPPECCRILPVKADKSALVQFETNKYSVPSDYAYNSLWLKAFVDRIEITDTEKIIASHSRLKGKFQEAICFEHYRKILERKPGGFRHLRAVNKEPLPVKSREPGVSLYPQVTVQKPNLTVYAQLNSQQPGVLPDHESTTSPSTGNPSENLTLAQCGHALS